MRLGIATATFLSRQSLLTKYSEHTQRAYHFDLDQLAGSIGPREELESITQSDVLRWLRKLRRGYSPAK